MNHSFECKCIGKISAELLSKLKDLAISQNYNQTYSWELQQSDFLNEDVEEIKQTIQVLNSFVKVKFFESAAFSLLPKMTYGPEHSDTWITIEPPTNCKIHVPVITNPLVGSMWPGYDVHKKAYVTTMLEGHIYVFNNVAKHSLVNLSQENRYHLLMEFREIECVE